MSRLLWIVALMALAIVFTGCAQQEPSTESAEAPREIAQYSIEDFLGATDYTRASFSPDGSKILVSSDESGVYNAYAIPVDGSEPVQLTTSDDDSIFIESYFPEDERFLFSQDKGGDELDHLFVQELDGSVQDLTPGEGLKASFEGWTQDETHFIVATNERDQKFFDVYLYSRDGYVREMIYQNDEGYDVQAVSPDLRYLALVKSRTTNDNDLYLFDRQAEKLTHLTPHEGDVSYEAEAFTLDGSGLYYLTDLDSEFKYLASYDLETGDSEKLVQPSWDVWYATPSKSGKHLVVGINNDARTEIQVYDTASMERLELADFPLGDISQVRFSPDETMLSFYVSSGQRPGDLFVSKIGEGDPRQLTRSLPANIEATDLVEGEVVRFASYDGVEVPGVFYKPHQVDTDSPAPALIWVHGGPGGQSRLWYSGLTQYLVNHGYVVYAINNRGSSGEGKTFYAMDDRRHGEADLGDCVASKQMLIDTGFVDPDRIGIIGGSYGGYMVLAALTLQPEEFAVGVDLFGISNWMRTLESIPPWWESFREALYTEMGDPVDDKERLTRISPLFNADKIVKPLMVLQGANDPRVLQVESDDIVAAARANGVPVEYVLFEDEGHGFQKKENRVEGYRKVLDFLDEYLKGPIPVSATSTSG